MTSIALVLLVAVISAIFGALGGAIMISNNKKDALFPTIKDEHARKAIELVAKKLGLEVQFSEYSEPCVWGAQYHPRRILECMDLLLGHLGLRIEETGPQESKMIITKKKELRGPSQMKVHSIYSRTKPRTRSKAQS